MISVRSKKWARRLPPHLQALPIFPLARVELFPKALLPLYVFEPRYRELTAACLAGSKLMAVAALRPGYEENYPGRPEVRPVAGLGRIVAHRQNPDGTYNILLRGLSRVRIVHELPPTHTYREVQARLLRDRWPDDYDLLAALDTLVALTQRLAGLIPADQGGEALRALAEGERTPGRLADLLSAAIVRSAGRRQRLLATRDVSQRVELVSGELARLIARLSRGRGSSLN